MKNLKKGLAVAMSLAMVATVLPTNVKAATVNDEKTCTTTGSPSVSAKHYGNLDKLDELTKLKLDEATKETKVTLGGTEVVITALVAGNGYYDVLTYFTADRDDSTNKVWACSATDSEYKANKAAAQKVLDVLELFGAKTVKGSIAYNLDMINITAIDETTHTKTAVKDAIKFLADNADHLTDKEAAQAEAYTAKAEKAIANYDKNNGDINADVAVDKIAEIVETKTGLNVDVAETTKKLTITGVTEFDYKGLKAAVAAVEELVDGLKSDVRRDSKVKAAVKAVTDAFEKAEEAGKYNVVIDDFFTELEDLRDTTLSTFNSKIEAATDVAVKLTADNKAGYGINEYDTFTGADVFVIDVADVTSTLGDTVNSDVIEALNSIVEGLEDFVTISIESTGRRYNVYVDKGDYFAYLGNQEGLAIDLAQILMAPTFKDGKLTGDTLLDALEESIEDVTADYNKVIKATKLTDAIEDLYQDLKTSKNLTAEEQAKLHMAYYKLKGITGQIGWVDLGNGNWDFFNEDGSVATKWVAAGKDWYYVKASHMLRNSWVAQDASGAVWYYVDNAGKMVTNTTVDGYVINANGEWHK